MELSTDSEYRRLKAVRDMAEEEWHAATINYHIASKAVARASASRKESQDRLNKYIQDLTNRR